MWFCTISKKTEINSCCIYKSTERERERERERQETENFALFSKKKKEITFFQFYSLETIGKKF